MTKTVDENTKCIEATAIKIIIVLQSQTCEYMWIFYGIIILLAQVSTV